MMMPRAILRTAGCVLLAILLIPSEARGAQDPWKFPGGEKEQRDAEKKYGLYWYEVYPKAVSLFKESNANFDEVIARLRLVASRKPQSGCSEVDPHDQAYAYVPYYWLAQAFYRVRNYEAAARSLDKELEQQKIMSCKPALPVKDLRDAIDARQSAKALLALADDAAKWDGASPEVPLLNPDSRALIAQVRDLAKKADSPDVSPTLVFNPLKEQLAHLYKNEFQARDPYLSQLLGDAWKAAFPDAASRPKAGSCQAPAIDGTTPSLKAASDALKECNRVVVQSARIAGSRGCDDLAALRKRVDQDSQTLRQWVEKEGGARPAAETLSGLPPSCAGFKSAEPSAVKLLESFKTLGGERATVAQALEARGKEITGLLSGKRGQLRDKLKVEQARILNFPGDCAQTLQVGPAAANLAKLRGSLSPDRVTETGLPPDELFHLEKRSQVSTEEIVNAVKEGAGRLEKQGSHPDLDKSHLARLSTLRAEFEKSPTQASLDPLCATAREVAGDFHDWLKKNIPVLTASVERSLTLVSAAARAMPAPAGPDCLSSRTAELSGYRNRLSGGAADSVISAVDTAVVSAQACLTEFHQKAQERFAAVQGGVRGALDMVDDAVAGLQSQTASKGAANDTVARLIREAGVVRGELQGAGSKFEKVRPLYKSAGSADEVRQALEGAGLKGNVPNDAWQLLSGPADKQKADMEVSLVARDAAVAPELSKAEATLKGRDAFIRKLSPFAALSRAYLVFSQGDLDGAILSLRDAQRKRRIPDKGTGAALVHAVLSHFLFLKTAALTVVDADREVLQSMKQDAEQEAKLAVNADAGFDLPGRLFPSKAFRDTFQTYKQGGVR